MHIDLNNKTELSVYNQFLTDHIQSNFKQQFVKYVNLGSKIVKIISYSADFLPLMQKQLTYTLQDYAPHFDATMVVWQENIKLLSEQLLTSKKEFYMRARLDKLMSKKDYINFEFILPEYSPINPAFTLNCDAGILESVDLDSNTYFYGVEDLAPEEFIKQGHIFVQTFNRILQSPTVNLVHGAVVGMQNNGVLFCARGQRGKSTLTVLSMIRGFEYVSDDYLILEQKGDELLSSPIYSIITLSPRMYNELYDDLKGKFISNNARKDKYVINIADYHSQFRRAYPIKLCIFPEIVSDPEPDIHPCSATEKGRAIVQLIQSTVSQMRDFNNTAAIRKIFNMVKDQEFYKLNLCNDIEKNTAYLKEFLQNWQPDSCANSQNNEIMLDITFDLANILDIKNYTIYSMNKFATNLYENLLNGVSEANINATLQPLCAENPQLLNQFADFMQQLRSHGFLNVETPLDSSKEVNMNFARECKYKLSLLEFSEQKTNELIK